MDKSGLKSQESWGSEGEAAGPAEVSRESPAVATTPGAQTAADAASRDLQRNRAIIKAGAALAWLVLAAVVFVTLGPLSDRPGFGYPQTERFAGFFVLAAVWTFAYPNRKWAILVISAAGAVGLELAQGLAPDRHPGFPDVLAKLAGVLVGVALPVLILRVWAARPAKR
jgi:hypothetical protein